LGAVGTILIILIPTIVHYTTKVENKKVDKDLCLLRHTDLDKSMAEIKATANNTNQVVNDISKSVVRVETLLNK
jgi:hypothetical protein